MKIGCRSCCLGSPWGKLDHINDSLPTGNAQLSGLAEDVLNFFGVGPSTSGLIPSSILAAAPHLGKLVAQVKSDPHLDETQRLWNAFNKMEQAQDVLVNNLQVFTLAEPLPWSIWKKIVQDDFVDFEKLYASMEKGYDHKNEPKMLVEGFAIVKKDQAMERCPVHTEAEWIHVFSAWEAGVGLLFPHHVTELQS